MQLELESFLRAIRERTQPEVTAQDGRAALAVALDINRNPGPPIACRSCLIAGPQTNAVTPLPCASLWFDKGSLGN